MSLLRVEGLCAGYGGGDVLHDVNLHVEEGELVAVLGANGAGKTTLMRALSGLLPRRGRIDLRGREITGARPETIVRAGVAQVPQGRGTFADLTVEENLRAGALVRGRDRTIAADLDHWYTTYPRLRERRTQKAGLLSGGEQQMLAVARALMSRPALLLCDEPSLGLSPKLTEELFVSLREINAEGMAVLVVEQNAAVALRVADRAYLLELGSVARALTAAQFDDDEAIRSAYLGG
jgi:branched-chain amino acid transport system ATP-binding protein